VDVQKARMANALKEGKDGPRMRRYRGLAECQEKRGWDGVQTGADVAYLDAEGISRTAADVFAIATISFLDM
jgi:hypothetical protein